MKKKISVRPGKANSMVGFAAGLVFCGIGLFVAIPNFGAFGVFWTLMAVVITVSNAYNAFSESGMATHTVEIEEEDGKEQRYAEDRELRPEALRESFQEVQQTPRPELSRERPVENVGQASSRSIQKRLIQLNDLYDQRLISKEEFDAKKAEILKEL